MKKIRQTIIYIIFLLIIITPLISVFTNSNNEDLVINKKNDSDYTLPKTSDIAGTDLYSEQITAYVAGSNSIIQQSLFTNDTNIFSYFDVSDPAFYKCNVLISVSNSITPSIFPKVLIESEINQYSITFNGFSGFLYYKDTGVSDVQYRAERALEIIKRKFEIDLIMVKVPEQNCYVFVGYYPNWNTYFHEITSNLPMDGYWKALNVSRLGSDRYTSNYFLSSTFLLINSLEFLEEDFQITTDQVNFNIESLDLSILENIGMENLFNQLTNLMEGGGGGFGNISQYFPNANATLTTQDIEQINEGLSFLNLANDSHYSFLTIQYEGLNEGIEKKGNNQYQFNLWDAIGYNGEPLSPSKKIYIALTGAFMSKIDVNILCTDIIDATPEYFEFNNFLLEQLDEIFFLMGIDFNTQTLKDYSFELLWVYVNGIIRNYVKPVNLNDPNDVINLLTQFGFQGIPSIPSGLLDPVEDFIVTYNISYSEPNILITRGLIGANASFGIYRGFVFNITAKNVGNESVWGVSTSIPITLDTVFLLLAGPLYAEELRDAMWEVVGIEYPNEYDSLEEFLNIDEDPRIFQFDSLGTGIINYYYPDIANVSNLWPYNEKMDNVIDKLVLGYPQLMASIALLGNTPSVLKEIFTNKYSIWNEDNWKLDPGETIQFNTTEIDISNLDSFSPFYDYNFSINSPPEELPNIISGMSIGGTNSSMALSNDNQSWIIESEEKYTGQHEIEIEFFFSNQSDLDLINNTIDEVSIIINFTDQSNASSFEIFNFSMEEYQDMIPYLSSIENNSWTFSFVRTNNSLDWLFNPSDPNNHTLIVKLKAITTNIFNISINDIKVEFSERDIVTYEVSPSRVIFASFSRNIQYTKESNTITLSTCDMASLETTSFLSRYSSKGGELNTYSLTFKNIGSSIARNISISILIPGIINNTGGFKLDNNYLRYNLSELAPSQEIIVNFTFYTPNSGSVQEVQIKYNNTRIIKSQNSSFLNAIPNEVHFSAPIDYESRFPYVRIVMIDYRASNSKPVVKKVFTLSVDISNISPEGINISGLNLSMDDSYGDLVRWDNNNLTLTNISYGETESINITLKKVDWKGYYYPAINFLGGYESRTVQIYRSNDIILGTIGFSIKKLVNHQEVEIGNNITVYIEITNNGTIAVKDFSLNDMLSYNYEDFDLLEGNLVHNISSYLNPGEKITFSYVISTINQKTVNLSKAVIDYYYLQKLQDQSNIVELKIIAPRIVQFLFLIVPCVIALSVMGVYYWQKNKYNAEKFELQRSEMLLFGLSSRDSLLRIEHTLKERLDVISKSKPFQKDEDKAMVDTEPLDKKNQSKSTKQDFENLNEKRGEDQ